jgi:sugar O-acyltransferase (sialic acid O-acetyltransferase NeuD family)
VKEPVVVIGGGGHAKVLVATLLAAEVPVEAVFDDDEALWGGDLLGVPIRGPAERVADEPNRLAILGIGSNATRKRFAETLPCRWTTVVHPSAVVHGSATLGPGTVVFAGAVIQPDARVGAHAIVNTSSSIDHDCQIGDWVHLGPGVRLCGGVILEAGVMLGVGSVVTPLRRVGAWTTVGAGAVVVRDLPPGVTAVGVPAREVS